MGFRRHGPVLHDPGRLNLRKAARAAIVATSLFAFAVEVLDNEPLALFISFGSFAALVFADFGGPIPRRFVSYLGLVGVGCAFVAIGTLLSQTTVAAAIGMAVVAFTAVFLAVLGGPWAAGQSAATLAYVLAVMVPAPAGQLGGRELGWALGVGVAGIAAIVLWPAHPRVRAREACATAAAAIARLTRVVVLGSEPHALDVASRDVDAAVAELHHRAVDVVYRPAGTAARDRALGGLVVDLIRGAHFVGELDPAFAYGQGAQRLAELTAELLESVSRVVMGDTSASIDLHPIAAARREQEGLMEQRVAELLAAGESGAAVVERLHPNFEVRGIAVAAAGAGVDAALLADRASDLVLTNVDLPELPLIDVRSRRHRVEGLLRANLDPRSVRFQNALRTAIGLTAAVVLAKILSLEHAFWVVLGTLSVLRSGVLGTGVSALEALAGTAVGFAVATGVINIVGTDRSALWIVLPVAIFLSGYTPGAVHFVVGQASFTVFVVVLFNVLVPQGWETGLVRLENIALGVSVSILAGALLWPRGAARAACTTFAALLRATGNHLEAATRRVSGSGDDEAVARTHREQVDARVRADSAFEELAHETVGHRPADSQWTTVLAASSRVALISDIFTWAVSSYGPPSDDCAPVAQVVQRESGTLRARLDGDAAIATGAPDGVTADDPFGASLPTAHAALAECLTNVAPEVGAVGPVVRLGLVQQWLEVADDAITSIDEPVALIGELARRPWWR